ncbi:hypothetical protein FIBSPDRAFT_959727 [Athelia psychrophila]|uniref:Proliferating cell nuclear antigen PCNA N-terminal domain-containing protein n=1 Tax=Athelia psychrophila TaxID=1759441 RepID=A0A166D7D2_9AGAM|nr:hypothetical protein FIBSPDRAFT_959727 [Fibularhizoctonia sp. CBS 109695]
MLKRLLDVIKELVTDTNFESLRPPDAAWRDLGSLWKVLKCVKHDNIVTLKAGDDTDVLNLTYGVKSSNRVAEYRTKLMDIDSN